MQVGGHVTDIVGEGTSGRSGGSQAYDLNGVVSGKGDFSLQLNGRNFTQVVKLVPGVSSQRTRRGHRW